MCLVVEKGTNKRKAKADILVYKCLDECGGNYSTPFYYFPVYFEDGKCVLKVKHFTYNNDEKVIIVEEGIHSYYNKSSAQKIESVFYNTYGTNRHYAIIPKGVKYYIGNDGDVVSTELIIFETEEDYNQYVKSSEKICVINNYSLSLREI